MIDDFYNEQEQWERVKQWMRENGPWLVAGVLIGVGALAGWRWWEARVERLAVEASEAYSGIVKTLESGDRAAAIKQADELLSQHGSSAYAEQADLLAARVHVDANELGAANERLTRVMNESDDVQLALVARMRLARVQLAQGDAAAALATLTAVQPGGFAARFAEIRGDALHAKGDLAGALAAWREAEKAGTAKNATPTVDPEGLRLKIADVEADGVKAPAAKAPAAPAAARP